ncbi:MAG: DUF4129 domain-containing protein [Sporichthyaceae bacterium]
MNRPLLPDPTAAREAAAAELSKPPYRAQEPSLLERGADWVWGKITGLFEGASTAGPGAGWATGILVALLVLAVVVAWTKLGRREARLAGGAEVFAEAARTAAAHDAAADAALAAGDLETAVVERFRALVRGGEERGLLVPRPGRTADEAASELAARLPDAAGAVRAAAVAFDEVRYGGRWASPERHETVAAAARTARTARIPEGVG